MGTPIGAKRTSPRKPLRRVTPLRRTTALKKMSKRAKLELTLWRIVRKARMLALAQKYGYLPCEYCHKPIDTSSELYCPEGHHNNHNRRDNSPRNCRILHRVCNQTIEDLNVKDVPSLL